MSTKFKIGQKIKLLAFDNGSEIVPEELGIVLACEGDGMYIIEGYTDGICEVDEEQIQAI